MLSCAQAAAILEVQEDAIDALICGTLVHTLEMVTGNQRICKNSLFASSKDVKG